MAFLNYKDVDEFILSAASSEEDATPTDKSGEGYFVGIVNKNTAHLISTPDDIVACSSITTLVDKEACDPARLREVKLRLADYIHRGARTKPAAAGIPVLPVARPDPNPIATNMMPAVRNDR